MYWMMRRIPSDSGYENMRYEAAYDYDYDSTMEELGRNADSHSFHHELAQI